MANNVRIKVGNGKDKYSDLPFLGRTLTKKEKNYVISRAVDIVTEYFKENAPEIVLSGETDGIRKNNNEETQKHFSPRTHTPEDSDDVINIKDDIITSNYQYKRVALFDWENGPEDITTETPELITYIVRYWIDKDTLFYSEDVVKDNYVKGPSEDPENGDFIFIKWDFISKPINADTDIYALWREPEKITPVVPSEPEEPSEPVIPEEPVIPKYTVKYVVKKDMGSNEVILKSVNVEAGESVTPPDDPVWETQYGSGHYIFNKWSETAVNVQKNMTIYGEWYDAYTGASHASENSLIIECLAASKNISNSIVYVNGNEEYTQTQYLACLSNNGHMHAKVDGTNVPIIIWDISKIATNYNPNNDGFAKMEGYKFYTNGGTFNVYGTTFKNINTQRKEYSINSNMLRFACFSIGGPDSYDTDWMGGGNGTFVNTPLNTLLNNGDTIAIIKIKMPKEELAEYEEFQNVGWHFHVNDKYITKALTINRSISDGKGGYIGNGKIELSIKNNNNTDYTIRHNKNDARAPEFKNSELLPDKFYELYLIDSAWENAIRVDGMSQTKLVQYDIGIRPLSNNSNVSSLTVVSDAIKDENNNFIFRIYVDGVKHETQPISKTELTEHNVEVFDDSNSYLSPIDINWNNAEYTFTSPHILDLDINCPNPHIFNKDEKINMIYYSGCHFIKYN